MVSKLKDIRNADKCNLVNAMSNAYFRSFVFSIFVLVCFKLNMRILVKSVTINKKRWYECQWDTYPFQSQCINSQLYRPKYNIQHWALARTQQQAITGPKLTSLKKIQTWKSTLLSIQNNMKKWNIYKSHPQLTTTVQQAPAWPWICQANANKPFCVVVVFI